MSTAVLKQGGKRMNSVAKIIRKLTEFFGGNGLRPFEQKDIPIPREVKPSDDFGKMQHPVSAPTGTGEAPNNITKVDLGPSADETPGHVNCPECHDENFLRNSLQRGKSPSPKQPQQDRTRKRKNKQPKNKPWAKLHKPGPNRHSRSIR